LPANLGPNTAYVVHFEHASGSPNGLGIFPKTVNDGLISVTDRSASSRGDGIPDSWRLRYFGTLQNALAEATADADGDGVPNWSEFRAGTNPNDAGSKLHLRNNQTTTDADGRPNGMVLRWPTTAGKTYVIESAPSLFGSPWTPVTTVVQGTGSEVEFRTVSDGNGAVFYRVRLVESPSAGQ
jgi:hypothetical protein